jgi:ribosomal protein S27E
VFDPFTQTIQQMVYGFVTVIVVGAIIFTFQFYLNRQEVVYSSPIEPEELGETFIPKEESEDETPKAFIYKCPRCSADIDFEEGQTRTMCHYCGAHVHADHSYRSGCNMKESEK